MSPNIQRSNSPLEHVTQPSAIMSSFLQRVREAIDDDDDDYDIPAKNVMDVDTPSGSKIQELMRHWLNERSAPEILQCQTQLLNGLLDFVADQAALVNNLRGDPQTTEEEHFQMMLIQLEMERIRFLARGYMRARLYKIEQLAPYIVAHPEIHSRLTSTELQHAKRYAELTEKLFTNSVLSVLPESMRSLTDDLSDQGIPPMVTPPQLRKPVFIRALKDCGEIPVADGHTLTLSKGSIHLVPYQTVQQQMLAGDIELL